jgi:hypothetical protein
MPHAVSGLHPFEPTRRDEALLSRRVLIGEASAKNDRERCDARVRMDAEERLGPGCDFGVIQKYKRLDQLADIGGADEARDGPLPATAGRERDSACADVHGSFRGIRDIEAKAGAGDDCRG